MLGRGLKLVDGNENEWELNQLLFEDDTVVVADSERKLCQLVTEFGRVCEMLRRLELLPGVTPLFREHGRSILGTLSHFLALLPFSISVEYFNCWSEENTGKHL